MRKRCGLFQNNTGGLATGLIPFYTSGFDFHVPQQRLGTAEVFVDTLAADAQFCSNLAQGQVLIISQFETFLLPISEQITVLIV